MLRTLRAKNDQLQKHNQAFRKRSQRRQNLETHASQLVPKSKRKMQSSKFMAYNLLDFQRMYGNNRKCRFFINRNCHRKFWNHLRHKEFIISCLERFLKSIEYLDTLQKRLGQIRTNCPIGVQVILLHVNKKRL